MSAGSATATHSLLAVASAPLRMRVPFRYTPPSVDPMLPAASRPLPAIRDDLDALRSVCREIRAHLERSKRSLDEEIRSYPTPIPRCDAQFNFLYEQRSRLAQALALATAALEATAGPGGLANFARQFANAPPCTDDRDETELRSRLQAALSLQELATARFASPQG